MPQPETGLSPVDADVVIMGGGMSGVAAALAARQAGSRVLLAERHGFLGGAATAGSVAQFVGWTTRSGRRVIRGIAEQIVDRLVSEQGAHGLDTFVMSTGHLMNRVQYDPEILRAVLDDLLTEAGVTVLFHATLSGVRMHGDRLAAVQIATQKGLLDLEARSFIDATGDMALLGRAGAGFLESGSAGPQPATMMFAMAPVDFTRLDRVTPDQRRDIVQRGLTSGDLPRAALHYSRVPESDVAWFNISRVTVDATDPFSMSAGEMEGRRQARRIARFLRASLPGCEAARLSQTAPQLGVRDTRRTAGDYVLTADDLRTGRVFEDTICCGAYPIDIHHPNGSGLTIEEFGEDHFYRIPYRSLL
ncbi:MAG: FAD-dependent oxidoreductase, partial [Rhodospirillales bacterium]